jgi:hypothetical protein
MFNFFSKKNERNSPEERSFNIFDVSTWHYATTKEFFWNGRSLPENTFIKNRSELETANFIGGIITAVYGIDEFKPGIIYIGKNSAIIFLLEKTFTGISLETLHYDFFEYLRHAGKNRKQFLSVSDDLKQITETYPKIYSMLKESGLLESEEKPKFDILDFDTWQYASDSRDLIWNGKPVHGTDGSTKTEKDFTDFYRLLFQFLERNGNIIPVDKKIGAVKNMLNRGDILESDPDYYIRQYKEKQEELDMAIPDGLFDPRDPETYKFAKNKPLIIDGVQIFSTHEDATGKEIKQEETEKDFSTVLSNMLKMQNSISNLTKEQEREYINDHIQLEIDRCTSHETEWTYGGYNFSEAQMELADDLTDEERTKIGEIMVQGLSGRKRSYQIKQDLFDSLGNKVDGEFFVKLHNGKGYTKEEEGIMLDFYSGYDDFESKDEIYKFFNESKYLKKHKKLKESVIENALSWIDDIED